MGLGISRAIQGIKARSERRLLLLGLDNAGKTIAVLTAALSQRVRELSGKTGPNPSPTAPSGPGSSGFTVETFKHGKLSFDLWDVGGEEKLRPYWRHYYTGTQGVLFVVDGADRERLAVASLELRSMANDEQLAAAAVAVVINRRKGAAAPIPVEEVKATLGLDAALASHPWRLLEVDAADGSGLPAVWDFFAASTKPI